MTDVQPVLVQCLAQRIDLSSSGGDLRLADALEEAWPHDASQEANDDQNDQQLQQSKATVDLLLMGEYGLHP